MKSFNLCLILLSLGLAPCLAACSAGPEPQPTATPTPTPTSTAAPLRPETATATPTLPAVEARQTVTTRPTPESTPAAGCPVVDFIYRLEYTHEVVQTMPNLLLESRAEPEAAFFFVVHENGAIESAEFDNLVRVDISGTFEGCTLAGVGELTADISGECRAGMAYIDIRESWRAVTTTTTCPGQQPQTVNIAGMFSAPEDQFAFALNQEGDTRVLEADIEILSAYYSWTLFEDSLGVYPLP